MATLNGWQRLWVVMSGVWAVLWVAWGLTMSGLSPSDGDTYLPASLAYAVVPPVLLYAAGLGVAWIRRGFQQRKA